MRNLKILGLAFVAMLAMSAVAASAASADDKLTAESYPATLTGEKDGEFKDVFTSTAGSITCTNPKYHGELTAAATTVAATANYGETAEKQCTAFGFPATIHMNGCSYLFHVTAGTLTELSVDIVCPVGQEITITANPSEHGLTQKCTVHVPAQNGLETVTATNIGAGATRDITLDINIEKIKYTHTAGTGLGACASGSGTTGQLSARATIKADVGKTAVQQGLFMSAV